MEAMDIKSGAKEAAIKGDWRGSGFERVLQELPDDARIDAILAAKRACEKKERENERRRRNDPLVVGRWVTLCGLKTDTLNKRIGMVIQDVNEAGRVGVLLWGAGRGEGKLIKTINLESFPDDEIVKIARFGANGERSDVTSGVRTWFWPRRVLRELPMEVSPVSQLIGVPLCAAKVEPQIVFTGSAFACPMAMLPC